VFAIQDVISERILSALQIKLDADEQDRLFRRYTENTAAFDAYLRGRNLLSQYTPESTIAALAAFEEALQYDPNYALARDGLATASAEMFLRFANESDSGGWARRADDEIAKALALIRHWQKPDKPLPRSIARKISIGNAFWKKANAH
jgi:adenylate cyclase